MKAWFKHQYKAYMYWYWRIFFEAEWAEDWRYEDQFYIFANWLAPFVLCLCYFHEPVDDQCMKPEHRFCWKCQAPTPNAKVVA